MIARVMSPVVTPPILPQSNSIESRSPRFERDQEIQDRSRGRNAKMNQSQLYFDQVLLMDERANVSSNHLQPMTPSRGYSSSDLSNLSAAVWCSFSQSTEMLLKSDGCILMSSHFV